MINNIDTRTNEELVEAAGEYIIGTPSGLKSQQAQAELMSRLIYSNKNLNSSTQFSNWMMIILTVVLVILTIVLVFQGFKIINQ